MAYIQFISSSTQTSNIRFLQCERRHSLLLRSLASPTEIKLQNLSSVDDVLACSCSCVCLPNERSERTRRDRAHRPRQTAFIKHISHIRVLYLSVGNDYGGNISPSKFIIKNHNNILQRTGTERERTRSISMELRNITRSVVTPSFVFVGTSYARTHSESNDGHRKTAAAAVAPAGKFAWRSNCVRW